MKRVFPILLLGSGLSAAELTVYPGADPALACPIYAVRVTQGDRTEEAFVYQSQSDWDAQSYFRHKKFYESLSYTGFAFTGEVAVEVTKVGRVRAEIPTMAWRPDLVNPPPPTGVVIRPQRFAIQPQLDGWTARFTIDRPGQYSVEFVDRDLDPSGTPLHGLMIFADPPEDPDRIPRTSAPEVFRVESDTVFSSIPETATIIRFEPGVHERGPWVVPSRIKQIYLAPGAFVRGCLSIRDRADGFVLNGRGVLSAHHLGWHARAVPGEEAGWYELPAPGKDYLKLLIIEGDHLTVDGIVLADSPFHTIGGSGTHQVWSWVKVIGWRYNNDGIPGFEDSVIRNSFIRANDDAVWLYHDNLLVHDLVMWQGDNGACFQLGWSSISARNITVRDVDVIHAEWGLDRRRNNSGLVNLRLSRTGAGGPGVQENFRFENINVESPVATGIDIRMRKEAGEGGGPHVIRNFTFRNVSLQLEAEYPYARNFLVPWDADFGFENLRFENLRVNGVVVSESNHANEGRFDISPETGNSVHFLTDSPSLAWLNPLPGLPREIRDPTLLFLDGHFSLVTTDATGLISGWSSTDLMSWQPHGALLEGLPAWGGPTLFAPRLVYDPVRRAVFLVFQSGSGIGLASARGMDGPWTLLNPDRSLGEGSHPALFVDDDGYLYLVIDGVRMTAIDPENLQPIVEWVALTPEKGSRATVLKKNGIYHLFWTDDHQGSSAGRYAVARSVMGPYLPSLLVDGSGLSIGQILPGPDGRDWLLSVREREVALHPLTFDETSGLFLMNGAERSEWRVNRADIVAP